MGGSGWGESHLESVPAGGPPWFGAKTIHPAIFHGKGQRPASMYIGNAVIRFTGKPIAGKLPAPCFRPPTGGASLYDARYDACPEESQDHRRRNARRQTNRAQPVISPINSRAS